MKLIAGIDPGTTAAIALVDVSSGFYDVMSRKDFSLSSLCEYMAGRGDILVVATDKKQPPDFVKKAAATMNARLYFPAADIPVADKEAAAKNYSVGNDHERDALAAALLAKQAFSTTFEKVDRHVPAEMRDEVKELLLKGEAGNIESAIRMLAPPQKENVHIVTRIMETRKLVQLRRRIESLEKQNASLRRRVAYLTRKVETEKRKRPDDFIFRNFLQKQKQEYEKQQRNEEKRKKQIEQEQLTREIEKDNYIIIRYSENLTKDDIRDKIILAEKPTPHIVQHLEQLQPRAVIAENADENIAAGIAIIKKGDVEIKQEGGIFFASRQEAEQAILASFPEWLAAYKLRKERGAIGENP